MKGGSISRTVLQNTVMLETEMYTFIKIHKTVHQRMKFLILKFKKEITQYIYAMHYYSAKNTWMNIQGTQYTQQHARNLQGIMLGKKVYSKDHRHDFTCMDHTHDYIYITLLKNYRDGEQISSCQE